MKKRWKQKSDSLFRATKKQQLDKHTGGLVQHIPRADSATLDSLKTAGLQKAKAALPESGALSEMEGQLQDFTGGAGLSSLKNGDSLKSYAGQYAQREVSGLEDRMGSVEELRPLHEQQKKLEDLQQMPEAYRKEYEQYTDQEALKEQGKGLAKEKATDFFAQHSEQLQAVQKKISRLQKKYSTVLNSNDLSTAVKRTSLKGRPLRERLFIGGNFHINTLDPLSLDVAPQVGYKFNKRFVVGVGGTYRKTFADTLKVTPAIPAETYGYKAFASYDVIKSFFVYGEYERMTREADVPNSDATATEWVDGLMLGIGRRFSIHPKMYMNVLVLYNFLHEPENPIYGRQWTLKFGFQLSELALLKR